MLGDASFSGLLLLWLAGLPRRLPGSSQCPGIQSALSERRPWSVVIRLLKLAIIVSSKQPHPQGGDDH